MTIKNVLCIAIVVISYSNNCFASQVKDCYEVSIINKLPGGEAPIEPSVITIPSYLTKGTLKDLSCRLDSAGILDDMAAQYKDSNAWIISVGKTFTKEFVRTTCQSSLFLIRIGNTYKEPYVEENVHNKIYEIALFNTYYKGKVSSETCHTRWGISLGEHEKKPAEIKHSERSSHYVLSINMDYCISLFVAALLYKYKIMHAVLLSAGIPAHFSAPCLLMAVVICNPAVVIVGGGAMFLPFLYRL